MNSLRKILGYGIRIIYIVVWLQLLLILPFFLKIILFLLFLPGFFIAYVLDKVRNPYSRPLPLNEDERKEMQQLVYALAGYILAASGKSLKEQNDTFIEEISSRSYEFAAEFESYIDKGRASDFNAKEYCARFCKVTGNIHQRKISLLEFLVSLVFADGVITQDEYARLLQITNDLGIENYFLNRFMQQAKAVYEFKRFFTEGSSRYRYEEARTNGEQYNQAYVPHDDIKNACDVLGVSENASFSEITKTYKKLMLRYHPDKLKSQGYSEEMIKVYSDKAAVINQAYSVLEKYHKSKGTANK